MSADDYGRSLKGVGFNLLTADMPRALVFQRDVLGATVVYADEDFAAISGYDGSWMLHADHSYLDHPLHGLVSSQSGRGVGAELRIYDCPPDAVAERAREHEFTVLADAMDKPHGLREAFILDDDGYLWVPSLGIDSGAD